MLIIDTKSKNARLSAQRLLKKLQKIIILEKFLSEQPSITPRKAIVDKLNDMTYYELN